MAQPSYLGLTETLTAVDACRFAAGLHIPNWDFRDWSAAIFDRDNVAGADGLTWNQDGFRGWYRYGASGSYSLNMGTASVGTPKTRFSANSMRLTTYASTATVNIQNHQALGNCVFTEMLPFRRFFPYHYGRPVTLALTFRSNTGDPWVYGTHLVAYLGCYDANFNYLASAQLVFEDAGGNITPNAWQVKLASTAAALNSSTAFVQVHVGIRGNGADDHVLEVDSASLMLNPADDVGVGGAVALTIDLATVYLEIVPTISHQAQAVVDTRMLDGHLERVNTMKGGPFPQVSLSWWKEDAVTSQKLWLAWVLSTQGLGAVVPEPVPLCVDIGLGRLPQFGYFHAVGPFAGSFNPYWTAAGGGYDIGLNLVGV